MCLHVCERLGLIMSNHFIVLDDECEGYKTELILPVNSDDEIKEAEKTMLEMGILEADVWSGIVDENESVKTRLKIIPN